MTAHGASSDRLIRLTFDWNCVITVENDESAADSICELVDAHRKGELKVALLAASASENTKSKCFPGSASIFKERVAQLGWDDLPLVPMPCIFGLSYFDFCFPPNDTFEDDKNALWDVMAPNVKRDPRAHLNARTALNDETIQSKALKKWRNTWCDVISAYSHIHAGRDIFVTSNITDFQDKATELASLGMKHICEPTETRQLIVRLLDIPALHGLDIV